MLRRAASVVLERPRGAADHTSFSPLAQRRLGSVTHGSRRVGGIDDVVWNEPAPLARPTNPDRRRRHLGRRRLAAAGGVAVVALLGVGLAISSTGTRPGGDPHDHMYDLLSGALRGALPPRATDIRWTRRTPARWVTGCPVSADATSGWSPVSMSMEFVDGGSPSTIDDQLNAALASHGWTRHDEVITVSQGKNAHWRLAVPGSQPASAFAYAVPAGSDQWRLSASWRPPGPVGKPCP